MSGLAFSRYEHRNALKSGARWDHIGVFSDVLRAGARGRADLAYLREVERQYATPNLYLLAAGDQHVKDYPHDRMLRMLELAFRFVTDLWERVQPDVVISEGIDCVSSYALYVMARQKGVPFLWPVTRLKDRISFLRTPEERWPRMDERLAALQGHSLDGAERQMAEAYLDEFRATRQKPTYMNALEMPSLGLSSVRLFASTVRAYRADPANYIMTPPWKLPLRRLKRIARRALAAMGSFEVPVPGDNYAFFGLHYQPEASTLVWAPFHVDQPSIIEQIAKSLPVGSWLYVKEHPASVGRRPLSEYRRLRAIPHVKLISPNVNSHALIPNAACVVTITGTIGWEGLLYSDRS